MTAARRNQAQRCQKRFTRQQFPSRRRIQAVRLTEITCVAFLQAAGFHIAQDPGPQLYAFSHGNGIRMLRDLIRATHHVQAAHHNLGSPASVPARKFIGPFGEGQMNRNADHRGKGFTRRVSLKKVFIPAVNHPVRRCCSRDRRQCEGRRQYVLSETGSRVFWVKRIDQKYVIFFRYAGLALLIQRWGNFHFVRKPHFLPPLREYKFDIAWKRLQGRYCPMFNKILFHIHRICLFRFLN